MDKVIDALYSSLSVMNIQGVVDIRRPLGTSSVTRLLQQSADQTKDTAA